MPQRDRPAEGVHPRVVVGDPEVVEEGEHLDGERLVELEQPDVVDGQAGAGQRLLGGGDRAEAHHVRFDAGETEPGQPHLRGEPEFLDDLPGGEDAAGGAVVDAGGVARGHPAVRPERRLQAGQPFQGGVGAGWLVGGDELPTAFGVAGGDRGEVGLDQPVGVSLGDLPLGGQRVGVRPLPGDRRIAVVHVLRGLAHDQRGGVDELLGDEARVGVGALAHGMAAHVLHAAGDRDVVGADGDRGRGGGDGGDRAGAHPVDGVAGHGLRQPGQDARHPADGQALVAGLGGRGDRHVVDPFRRQCRVAPQQLTDDLDDQVVRSCLGVDPLGLAEGGSDAVDEHDVADGVPGRLEHCAS